MIREEHQRACRGWLAAALLVLPLAAVPQTGAGAAPKVFRYAFPVAETGFDPAQIFDIYSRTVTPHIFEALYEYDPLARPARIRPLTAAALPEVSADFRTYTVRIQPGIYFADDPAFKGKPRELVAQDYVYAFKRCADPVYASPVWSFQEQFGFLGMSELRQRAIDEKKPFDYDREIDGIRALDRYTIQFKVAEPRPRLLQNLASSDLFGAVAREVVEFYGDKIMEHPVGTGPFVLKQWRRSSLIVLERNPAYRDVRYGGEPAPDDAEGQALLARFKGRRLPMIDRVEVSIVDEQQPRWLSFLNGQADLAERVPNEFIELAMPNGKVAPNLAQRGIQGHRTVASQIFLTLFNMDDPVVGGNAPAQVALRRAIGLAMDVDREIRLVRRGQAVRADSLISPHTVGYDAAFRSENSVYDLPRAKALLDLYGYTDKDGDGWRDRPDGQPLVLTMSTEPDQQRRQLDEMFRRDMNALGLRTAFRPAKWPENLKAARAGKLMLWRVGFSSASPDGQDALAKIDSRQLGGQNLARFKLPEVDALYDRMSTLPDGPERDALLDLAKRIGVAYAPYKVHLYPIVTDMTQPWLLGYRRPLFWQEFWHTMDIDDSRRAPH
jgi:ABC-type transport system substrate-binding protein